MSSFFMKRKRNTNEDKKEFVMGNDTDDTKKIKKDIVIIENLTIKNNDNNTITIKEKKEEKKEDKKEDKTEEKKIVKKIKILGNKTQDKEEKKEKSLEQIYTDMLLHNNISDMYDNNSIENIDEDLREQIKSIESVEFTLLPNEEVKRISVCEINTTKWDGENSLFDQRMGIQDKNNICGTCGEQWKVCPGHFGHIELFQPIPHPIQIKLVLKYLQIFCRSCYKLVITNDRMKLLGFNKFRKEFRLEKIYEESEKILVCPHCSTAVPKFFNNEDSYFMKFTKTEQKPYKVSYAEINKIFTSISKEDFSNLDYDDERLHPKNLMIQNLLVLPPCARPFYLNGDESCHDDLTYKYIDIIKVNNKIKETTIETMKNTLVDALYFHIKTLFDNSKGKSRESINKRPIKCIKSRLKGKTGQIRNNLQGKRCDFNGRSVITAEANCMADEIVVPEDFAKKLTYPVNVNKLNLNMCQKLLDDDKVVSIIRGEKRYETSYACHTRGFELKSDDIIKRWDEETCRYSFITVWMYEHTKGKKPELMEGDVVIRDDIEHTDIIPTRRKPFELKTGDVIVRYIKDGDLVVLNRQPTLWKGSMRAKKVKIRPGKTIRFALSSTAAYNAD
jgi:DNA-directed RNA polymerase subunit A'